MSSPPMAPERLSQEQVYVSGRPQRTIGDVSSMGARQRRRRAFTLVLLTLVLPGSAQLAAGNRALGRFAIRAWCSVLGLAALLGAVFLLHRSLVFGLFSRGAVLTVV